MFENVRTSGVRQSFIATELGQPLNPAVVAGFSDDQIPTTTVADTEMLAGAVPVR